MQKEFGSKSRKGSAKNLHSHVDELPPEKGAVAPDLRQSATTPHQRTPLPPLTVTIEDGCQLLGVRRTTMWKLIKWGRVETISIGRRRLLVYSSLEKLATPPL